jgi:hypothetical protein
MTIRQIRVTKIFPQGNPTYKGTCDEPGYLKVVQRRDAWPHDYGYPIIAAELARQVMMSDSSDGLVIKWKRSRGLTRYYEFEDGEES